MQHDNTDIIDTTTVIFHKTQKLTGDTTCGPMDLTKCQLHHGIILLFYMSQAYNAWKRLNYSTITFWLLLSYVKQLYLYIYKYIHLDIYIYIYLYNKYINYTYCSILH